MSSTFFNSFYKRLTDETLITSQKELAALLGIDNSAISQAKKRNSIPHAWIATLSQKFDYNPEWIKTGRGEKKINRIIDSKTNFEVIAKVNARLSAGGGSFDVDSSIEGYYAFQTEWIATKGNSKNMVLMTIIGNSMEPEIKNGDTVLVDRSKTEILAGAIYAIGIDDTVMVKRIEKLPGKLVLLSENKNYAPVYIQGEEINSVRILGKVIWICREVN